MSLNGLVDILKKKGIMQINIQESVDVGVEESAKSIAFKLSLMPFSRDRFSISFLFDESFIEDQTYHNALIH